MSQFLVFKKGPILMQDFKKMDVSQTYHQLADQDQHSPKKSVAQLLFLALTGLFK